MDRRKLPPFPVIDIRETGANIHRLRLERDLSVRIVQTYFNFAGPQAIYRWEQGLSLPSLDNMYALSVLFNVPIEKILAVKASRDLDI